MDDVKLALEDLRAEFASDARRPQLRSRSWRARWSILPFHGGRNRQSARGGTWNIDARPRCDQCKNSLNDEQSDKRRDENQHGVVPQRH